MKLYNYALAAAAATVLASCGVSDRHKQVEDLMDDKEEWTADQTNEAIDIYLEGVKDRINMDEQVYLIEEKLKLEDDWEYKAKKASYWKDRKDEIKEARKKLKDKQEEIREKYED